MSDRRVGIGGGVFDPIHFGHLLLFNSCVEQLELERALIIPTFKAVHKISDPISDYRHRREMVRLACMSNPAFELNDLEAEAGGLSYTLETIRALKKGSPSTEFFLLVGLDNLKNIEGWYQPEDIFAEVTVAVGTRPVDSEPETARYRERVVYVDMPSLEISSTDIRGRVKEGRSIKYLVPPEVEEYIHEHGLYR